MDEFRKAQETLEVARRRAAALLGSGGARPRLPPSLRDELLQVGLHWRARHLATLVFGDDGRHKFASLEALIHSEEETGTATAPGQGSHEDA
jgi:hypothetical protein